MLLPEAFTVASIGGLCLPEHWQSSYCLRILYRAHTYFTMLVMFLIIASQTIVLIFLTRNMDDLAEAAFLFLTAFNASVKGLNMLYRRNKIDDLMDLFTDDKCAPISEEEEKIRLYYDKVARYVTLSVLALGMVSATCLGAWPLFLRGDDYIFALRTWQPYAITNELRYYVTQIHQMLALWTMLYWNNASDFMCSGFMIQICAQLQLMYCRLKYLPDDTAQQTRLLRQSVQHHLHIFEMTKRLETAFTPAILLQYILTSFVLCVSIYQLTTNRLDFIQTLIVPVYVSAIAVELLVYCWYGNEVTEMSLQFSDIICEVNWTKLDLGNRKSLVIMMLRSSLPIRITCGPLIMLSTDSYTRILKLSYSAFNVLRTSN